SRRWRGSRRRCPRRSLPRRYASRVGAARRPPLCASPSRIARLRGKTTPPAQPAGRARGALFGELDRLDADWLARSVGAVRLDALQPLEHLHPLAYAPEHGVLAVE